MIATSINRIAEAIEESHVDVVPKVMVGGGANGGGSLMDGLLAMVMNDKLGALASTTQAPVRPEVERIKQALRAKIADEAK